MGKVTTVSATALPCARRGDVRSGFEIWPKQMGNGKFLGKPECWGGGLHCDGPNSHERGVVILLFASW